jgi:hypothetical protein
MNGLTPYEKLCSFNSILLPHRFLSFPILILDECLWDIIYHTKTIDLMVALESLPTFQDHKSLIDFKYSLSIINNIYAQNVLDHYVSQTERRSKNHLWPLLWEWKNAPICSKIEPSSSLLCLRYRQALLQDDGIKLVPQWDYWNSILGEYTDWRISRESGVWYLLMIDATPET